MDPNSGNQRWSKWTFTIHPGGVKRPPFDLVKANAARFGRAVFGSASQMKIEVWESGTVVILVRSEGHAVHDAFYVDFMTTQWRQWAEKGWGAGTAIRCVAKLEAGSRQDGTPPDQLIIAPPLRFHPEDTHG